MGNSARSVGETNERALATPKNMWTRTPNHLIHSKGEVMKEYLILLAVIGVWVLLQRVILPKMGVPT
jgi:hypothetical protein